MTYRSRTEARVFERDRDDDPFRSLTDAELDLVAMTAPAFELGSTCGRGFVRHEAPNGKHFTIRDLIAAVEATERKLRSSSEWFGGIDVHHVFFEGLHPQGPGRWQTLWGS